MWHWVEVKGPNFTKFHSEITFWLVFRIWHVGFGQKLSQKVSWPWKQTWKGAFDISNIWPFINHVDMVYSRNYNLRMHRVQNASERTKNSKTAKTGTSSCGEPVEKYHLVQTYLRWNTQRQKGSEFSTVFPQANPVEKPLSHVYACTTRYIQ